MFRFSLDHEKPDDKDAIEDLLDRAFGPGRQAKTSYRYRQAVGPLDELSRVVRHDGRLVGTIRYWPVIVEDTPALLLGPVAADPVLKGKGIGRALVRETLALAAAAGHGLVLLVGDAGYYGAFGFEPAAASGIRMADEPDRVMVKPLLAGALEGVAGEILPWRELALGVETRTAAAPAIARTG